MAWETPEHRAVPDYPGLHATQNHIGLRPRGPLRRAVAKSNMV
jgi:hypothetical protein